jgi:hypothetical protein
MTLALKVLESRNCLQNALLAGIFLGDGRDQHCVASQYLAHNTRRFWHSRILHSDAREMIFPTDDLKERAAARDWCSELAAKTCRIERACGLRNTVDTKTGVER